MTRIRKLSRQAAAALMAVWLSGGILVFCCQNTHAMSGAGASCPMAKRSQECDYAKKKATVPAAAISSESLCASCCGFIPVLFDKERRVEPAQKQLAAPVQIVAAKLTLPVTTVDRPTQIFYRARLPDRQSSFVQNCVFRI